MKLDKEIENKYKLVKILSNYKIQKKIKKFAKFLESELKKNSNIVFIAILNGVTFFLVDLFKQLNPETIFNFQYACLASFNGENVSKVKVVFDYEYNLNKKDVIILEDIIDSGSTLTFFINHLKNKYQINSLRIYTLINKNKNFPRVFNYSFSSLFEIDDFFIVGYGFDYFEKYRNTKAIYRCLKK